MKRHMDNKKTIHLYSMKKIDDEIKEKLHKAIDTNNFYELKKHIDVFLGHEIWFGDYVEGDEFKFYLNGLEYYQPTRESIDRFLRDENRFIADSKSSKVYTVEEFWQMVEDCKDGMNTEKRVQNMSEAQKALLEADDWLGFYGCRYKDISQYDIHYNEFHNDGLRFCL